MDAHLIKRYHVLPSKDFILAVFKTAMKMTNSIINQIVNN